LGLRYLNISRYAIFILLTTKITYIVNRQIDEGGVWMEGTEGLQNNKKDSNLNFNIKSYEPFIIGIVLKQINLEILKSKLKKVLVKDPSFEVPSEPNNVPYGPQEIIGLKEGVELNINYSLQGISLESETREKVFEIFNEFLGLLEELDYKPEFSIEFYDLSTVIIGKTGNNPQKTINNPCIISDLQTFGKMSPKVSGITINSTNEEDDTTLNIIVEPRVTNPEELYYLNVYYRTKKLKDLLEFNESLNDGLNEIINSLEGKNNE